jgi:hypothetical protein
MAIKGVEASQMYAELVRSADGVIEHYEALKRSLSEKLDVVRAQQVEARRALAAVYLPRLDQAALDSAEQLTGFRGFSRRSPLAAMDNERRRLQSRITEIRAEDRYQRRTFLVGPVGEYTRALEEASSMLEPWQLECEKFEGLEGFEHLYTVGYDTPRYDVRWWEGSYWRNWKQGDAICDALELDDFGDDVLPAYEKVRGPRDQWRARREEVGVLIKAVHDLVMEHDASGSRMDELPDIYLAESRELLSNHLLLADPALLAQWAAGDRGIIMGLRTLGGLQAKIDFLNDAVETGLAGFISELSARREKFLYKSRKYLRGKHYSRTIPDRELDTAFSEKVPKYLVRCEKLELLAERVVIYDRYDSFELDNPPELWFYEFTGGKAPSRLTPSLRRWYDRNPGQTPRRDPTITTRRAAAAAPSSQRLEELGYLS